MQKMEQRPGESKVAKAIRKAKEFSHKLTSDVARKLMRKRLSIRLVQAAADNDIAEARRLIKAGADVNIRYWNGWQVFTPLMNAVSHENFDMCALLIDNGANVNVPNEGGVTAVMQASHRRRTDGKDLMSFLMVYPLLGAKRSNTFIKSFQACIFQ